MSKSPRGCVPGGGGSQSREKAVDGEPEPTGLRCQGIWTEVSSKTQRKIATTTQLKQPPAAFIVVSEEKAKRSSLVWEINEDRVGMNLEE